MVFVANLAFGVIGLTGLFLIPAARAAMSATSWWS